MGKEKCHKGKDPKKCSLERVKECHGDVKEHPCEDPKSKKKVPTSRRQPSLL